MVYEKWANRQMSTERGFIRNILAIGNCQSAGFAHWYLVFLLVFGLFLLGYKLVFGLCVFSFLFGFILFHLVFFILCKFDYFLFAWFFFGLVWFWLFGFWLSIYVFCSLSVWMYSHLLYLAVACLAECHERWDVLVFHGKPRLLELPRWDVEVIPPDWCHGAQRLGKALWFHDNDQLPTQ